jgi:uncharacterized SAM-binding protein YcdF (DUF218 family)
MPPLDSAVCDAGRAVLAYLSETDPLPQVKADAVIGFGVFDLTLPRFCGELYTTGAAARIIFTGGYGAGTGTLGGPEADVWREELRCSHPNIQDTHVLLENRSTNTAENIAFTAAQLAHEHPALMFGVGIRNMIIVASPSRLRRVQLTFRKHYPDVQVTRQLPDCDFDREYALYQANGVDYLQHLAGEIKRLKEYPSRGWIVAEELPADILQAYDILRLSSRTV